MYKTIYEDIIELSTSERFINNSIISKLHHYSDLTIKCKKSHYSDGWGFVEKQKTFLIECKTSKTGKDTYLSKMKILLQQFCYLKTEFNTIKDIPDNFLLMQITGEFVAIFKFVDVKDLYEKFLEQYQECNASKSWSVLKDTKQMLLKTNKPYKYFDIYTNSVIDIINYIKDNGKFNSCSAY